MLLSSCARAAIIPAAGKLLTFGPAAILRNVGETDMEQYIETGTDVVTVISEPGALTFATRKEWEPLPETRLDTLNGYKINMAFKGTSSVYFVLHDFAAPSMMRGELENRYKLVKVTDDEEGKQIFFSMVLSAAEVEQLEKNRLTLWD